MNHSANGIIAVGAPGSEARRQSNVEGFAKVYVEELTKQVLKYPTDYGFTVEQVPVVVEKMKAAFIRGSYNKDGRGITATCQRLGIKATYKALNAFFAGE